MANNQPTYDLSQLITISNGNELFVKKMVDIFCDQTPVMMKAMLEAYQANDLKKMGEIAHKIKPSIDNLKIISVTQRIREIEKVGSGELENVNLEEILYETKKVLTDVISSLKKGYQAK